MTSLGPTMPEFDHISALDPPRVGMVLASGSTPATGVTPLLYRYAQEVGFKLTYQKDKKCRGSIAEDWDKIWWRCNQGGEPRTKKHEDPNLHRTTKSQRVGCPFVVVARRTTDRPGGGGTCLAFNKPDRAWVVTEVKGLTHGPCPGLNDLAHNLDPRRSQYIPSDALPDSVKQKIDILVKSGGCRYNQIRGLLAVEFPDLTFSEKQVSINRTVKQRLMTLHAYDFISCHALCMNAFQRRLRVNNLIIMAEYDYN